MPKSKKGPKVKKRFPNLVGQTFNNFILKLYEPKLYNNFYNNFWKKKLSENETEALKTGARFLKIHKIIL